MSDGLTAALGSSKDRYYQSILDELMETITVEDAILLYKKGEDVTFLNDEQRYCIFNEYNFSYIKSLLIDFVLSNDRYYQELDKERFRIEKLMLQRSIEIFDNIVI